MDQIPADNASVDAVSVLTPEEEKILVNRLDRQYEQFKAAVAPLHTELDRWHQIYEAKPRSETKEFPWPDASNFNPPLIMSVVDSIHARLVKAVFDVDPIWLAKPRTPQGVSVATKAQWYLDYWADEMDLPRKMDQMLLNMLIEGVGILKIDWVQQAAQIPTIRGEDGAPMDPAAPQTIIEYEGPQAVPVPLKDFILIPATAPTLEEAAYVGHRVFRSAEQLRDRQSSGYYHNIDALISAGETSEQGDRPKHPSNLISIGSSQSEYEETQIFELVELFGRYDWGDGPIPTLFTYSPEHNILIRIEPYPYEFGRPPYIDFSVYPRANFFWSRGVPEILETIQEELTGIHNMRADALVRRITPPVLVKRGSTWDYENDPLAPRKIIEVGDMADIQELILADVGPSAFSHEADLMAFVERVTGMSDLSLGRLNNQYATATAVNRVTSEGLSRIDVAVSRIQQAMRRLAWVLWWLLYQYRPQMDQFHAESQDMVMMKAEMRPATPKSMMPFEFIPQGQLSDASRDAKRQQLLTLLQVVSPSLQQFYPDGIQHMLDKILREFDIQDRSQILGEPWGALQQQMQQAVQQAFAEGQKAGAAAGDGEE